MIVCVCKRNWIRNTNKCVELLLSTYESRNEQLQYPSIYDITEGRFQKLSTLLPNLYHTLKIKNMILIRSLVCLVKNVKIVVESVDLVDTKLLVPLTHHCSNNAEPRSQSPNLHPTFWGSTSMEARRAVAS